MERRFHVTSATMRYLLALPAEQLPTPACIQYTAAPPHTVTPRYLRVPSETWRVTGGTLLPHGTTLLRDLGHHAKDQL